ncbi:MAG: (2Fe-2S)-binding protein [Planctomycetes bacterium]|nr:(2Fe-2S)-binding protein [Planctomycetota bacterium]
MESSNTFEKCDFCPDRVVCHCLNVTEQEIIHAVVTRELQTIHEIRRQTAACDGCTCCHKDLQEIIERYSLTVLEV